MKRIRNRVFVQILLATILAYGVVVVGGLWVIDRSLRREILSQKESELHNAARALDNWITARVSEMVQLAHTPLMSRDDEVRIGEYLRREQTRLAFIYDSMIYVREDGSYLDSDGARGRLPERHPVSSFWTGDRLFLYEGPILRDPVVDDCLLIASAVEDEGRTIAAVAGSIPLDAFRRVVRYFTIEGFPSFTMVNARSTIITDSDRKAAGRTETEYFGQEFYEDTPVGERLAFVSVLRTKWKLVAFAERREVFSQVRQMNRLALIFFVTVILVIGVSSLVVSNAVVRPIRNLTNGVHRLMAGNYRQHVEVRTEDELRELADAFNRLADRLADRRRDDQFLFLGHFATRMAHEMRKPLHIAQLAAQALRSRSPHSEKHLQMVLSGIADADRFISEILNFGRPEQLNLTSYSIVVLVQKILRQHELVLEAEGITLEAEIDEKLPEIYMDILRMEQVISNLLENAIEAAKEEGAQSWIRVEARRDGTTELILSITDGGKGFDAETRERAMDPYFTTKEDGTGLGLSICYRILTAHGASIRLENTDEGYGRVTVRFPL
jgi:signal transduction histidine kinase